MLGGVIHLKDRSLSLRITTRLGLYCLSIAVPLAPALAPAQETAPQSEQVLTDIAALITSTESTTRCALYDSDTQYLTGLEQVAVTWRVDEMLGALDDAVPDLADRTAQMRADASDIACGSEALTPYLDFGRQIARDVVDVALFAWQEIDVANCNYFADEGFMRAVERARQRAEQTEIEGPDNRLAYIAQLGTAWRELFAANCRNAEFDPVPTLPGQIALSLPVQDGD